MASLLNYKTLSERLTRDASRATAARLYFSNRGVRRWLSRKLADSPGEQDSFLADPLFEATFGWKGSGKQWQDLQGSLLSKETINALDYKKSTHPIERKWSVYTHQLEALETLLQPEPRSLVVTSGTGSGKTECFLVPILESLARQVKDNNRPLEGVQALFLYPLNALINSQRERLSAWMSPFNGSVRYCLYNGETKPNAKETIPEQVLSRKRLRESPPPVLLTNATMLEYMLVRSEDKPILEQSAGQLKWIVLDEAHTYIGSQAAELALLLRRVMIGFDVNPKDVRFVATSATIGGDEADSKNKLREFLADLAGVSVDQVVVASGQREVPSIAQASASDSNKLDVKQLKNLSPVELYDHLVQSSFATFVRVKLSTKPLTAGDLQIATVERFGKISVSDWLDLISQFSRAVSADGEPFLPTRVHLFHRTFQGLWACINPQCEGKAKEIAEDEQWPWGSVHTHTVETCPHCNSLALELVRCSECGTEHLTSEEHYDSRSGVARLMPRQGKEEIDEFSLELAADQWESAGLDTAEDSEEDADAEGEAAEEVSSVIALPRYLPSQYGGKAEIQNFGVANDGTQSDTGTSRAVLLPATSGFRCAVCNSGVTERRSEQLLFRSARAGMPFYSLIAGRNLLRSSPAPHELNDRVKEALPADGRKILTFSDSRQGTARLSMSQQQDADRGFIRSQVYHQLAQAGGVGGNDQEADKLRKDIDSLEDAAKEADAVREIRDRYIVELKALLETTPALTWLEVRDLIANNKELTAGSRLYLNRISTLPEMSATEYANFCLYREFIRRPKKGSTLETLGLAALRYPSIEKITSVPAEVARRDIDLKEWRTLLTLMVNFVFRAGYAVDMPSDWERWIGERARTNVVRGPNQERVKGRIGWPTAKNQRSTIVRLLVKSLHLNLDDETDRQWLDSLFQNAWDAIAGSTPRLINNTGEGFQLKLADAVEIYTPVTVWQCPFTGRAFDRVFRKVSPYTPAELSGEDYWCTELKMPKIPYPFWDLMSTDEPLNAEQWLESDETVKAARHELLWENHSDLVARYSGWYGTGEHSAQQDSKTLAILTEEFNEGRVNILNCSTTMEMGVDIAGISAVMMNNAPPGPANYMQRAGRAGRRGETTAATLTICSTSAHGAMLFANPKWPFDTPTAVPRVSLESADITQRHVNALLLSYFLRPIANPLKTDCNWFYSNINDEPSFCEQFIAWLESTDQIETAMGESLRQLTQRTVLASQPLEIIVAATRASINKVMSDWCAVVDALEKDLMLFDTSSSGGSATSPAAKAVEFRLSRIRGEYLLHELATEGFLPGYGFPTDVVSFVTTTIDDLKSKSQAANNREDNRTRSRGYPSRDLPVAIREYAPGADIALDGRVYTSAGVLLNWHIPPGNSPSYEVQALKSYWSCRKCGAGGTTAHNTPEQCPSCGADKLAVKKFLEPAGFAVELTYKPHNDAGFMRFMPVTTPRLHINDAAWSSLANRRAGRIRYSASGVILYRNPGRHQAGYSICLRCGKAEEQTQAGEVASCFKEPHRRLRGGKDDDGQSICEASHEDHSIVRDHDLAHQSKTSIVELQFNDPVTGAPLTDETTAWSLAVAIRYGLVQSLGLEESEVSIAIQESSSESDTATLSILLFDTTSGGAGYTEHLLYSLPVVMRAAYQLLSCHCETCCHSCLLSYDTQHEISHLNRQTALEFIDRGLLNLLELPAEMRFFGASSRNEPLPLPNSLSAAINKVDNRQVDVVLSGNADDWQLGEWNFLQRLIQYGGNGGSIRLLIDEEVISRLPDSESRFLAALQYSKGVALFRFDQGNLLNDGGSLLAVTHSSAGITGWATSETFSAPGPNWGHTANCIVRGDIRDVINELQIEEIPHDLFEVNSSTPAGTVRLSVMDELNVSIESFGEKLWQLIFDEAPELKQQFESAGPAESIVYSDKYIKSPFCLRLFAEFVVAAPAVLIDTETKLNVVTIPLDDGREKNTSPKFFHHNWLLDNHRRSVATQLMTLMGWTGGAVDVLERSKAPHYRELTITWPDKKSWSMQLDQGFGSWNTLGVEHFPFDQRVPQQASIASRINPQLAARYPNFKTYFFFDVSL